LDCGSVFFDVFLANLKVKNSAIEFMFQIDTSFLMDRINSSSELPITPRRRPGTPIDFEMLLTTTKCFFILGAYVSESKVWGSGASTKSTKDHPL
jgi:hypothetical protein